jgi:hypothetical protein
MFLLLVFCISILNMRRNRYIFLIRICKRAESTMLYQTCACSCTEVFNAEGRFFDKNGTLAPFHQLYLYEDLIFELWILLMCLETMFVNINYLAIELIDVVNIIFNSSDVVVNIVVNVVVKWMCFEFENCICFVANSNIFLNLYRAYFCWLL